MSVRYVVKRSGEKAAFDLSKITAAIMAAVRSTWYNPTADMEESVKTWVDTISAQVEERLQAWGYTDSNPPHIEDIQNIVETALTESNLPQVADHYRQYRNDRMAAREKQGGDTYSIDVITSEGGTRTVGTAYLRRIASAACGDIPDVSVDRLVLDSTHNIYSGMEESQIPHAMMLAARTLVEEEPGYTYVAARLLLAEMKLSAYAHVYGDTTPDASGGYLPQHTVAYPKGFFVKALHTMKELLDDRLFTLFDLERLENELLPDRDYLFAHLGLQTLYDRYFLHVKKVRLELPQTFFMRVAMGVALNEADPTRRAIDFYRLLSSRDFMSSTPTLFNAGTKHSQLSSCYLTTVPDDLRGIYGALTDNAMLSKFAGGLGNDWTPVRAMGSHIKGTNGTSQGVVPFLKVANDTLVAVNQGGKRRGSGCAYLETWHLDVEEFMELRKNTGDERRRTHDMSTALWVNDLFLQRVEQRKQWTLFSPVDVPDLHDLYGEDFRIAYERYEQDVCDGKITHYKTVSALSLWRKALGMLFETGHPWITFKDPCNLRSPQQHVGVVHSSNLCTEITLNTSADEIAVCNLGSVNLVNHIDDEGTILVDKLRDTVTTAMRMLDNVIDINFYAVEAARTSNLRHRPVGLGIMGFHDALYKRGVAYDSKEAVFFSDQVMDVVSYWAIMASSDLAVERGSYESYEGSLWSQGILPFDSLEQVASSPAGKHLKVNTTFSDVGFNNWAQLRRRIKEQGMRNSNCLSIAPTATIANICGVTQSIEPTYQNLYVKSNLSGEFMVINHYLVQQLKRLGKWNRDMVNRLKASDGSVQGMLDVPSDVRNVFKTAFELDPFVLIECAARRQKWIDQSQSVNLYLGVPNGDTLHDLYMSAWKGGLKTTYYLRTLGATHVEKNTIVSAKMSNALGAVGSGKACSVDDPDCESCQ